jgi:hypothetical protein
MRTNPPNNEPNNLAVSLQGSLFNKGDYPKLVDVLAECERTTESWFIDDESQLALSRKGTTVGGDRVSWLAMRQVCKVLSSGLSLSLLDLLGMKREPEDLDKSYKSVADPDEDFSVGEAASLYNLALKKRFGRLFGFQAIRNSDTKVIEAVVGNRYRRLPNGDFVSAVATTLESCEVPLTFHSASVSGRKISIMYSADGHDDSPLRPGIRLVNSEIGDSAIKAAVVVMCENGSTMMSSYGKLSRVSHSGKDLMDKLSRLISSTVDKISHQSLSSSGLAKRIENSSRLSLGFSGNEGDEKRFKEFIEFLTERAGLTYFMAKRCLAMVLTGEEPKINNFAMLERSTTWPKKSAMDLVNAIMQESLSQRTLYYNTTDRFERVAWGIFFNKIALPDISSES